MEMLESMAWTGIVEVAYKVPHSKLFQFAGPIPIRDPHAVDTPHATHGRFVDFSNPCAAYIDGRRRKLERIAGVEAMGGLGLGLGDWMM